MVEVVKDFKFILKRIIIGVGVAFAIMYLKGNLLIGVYANQISPYNSLGYSEDFNSGYSSVTFDVPGDPWKSHGNGILRFSFGITKTSGSSTDPILTPRLVRAYNGSTAYVCSFGSITSNNSTWTGQSFSVECPMNMDSNGLTEILIAFIPFSQSSSSTFRLSIPPDMSFEVFDSTNVQVNVDTSATTGAINNQITNDNTNTQNIINNNNQNTQDIINSNKVCNSTIIDKSKGIINGFLSSTNIVNSSNDYVITDYYNLTSDTVLKVLSPSNSAGGFACFVTSNDTLLSCVSTNGLSENSIISIPSGASKVRFTISVATNLPVYSLDVCKNGNQAIADGQQQINDSITDDTGVADSDLEDLFSEFQESNTPISDLLTMPLTLIQAYIDGMSGTCQDISLGRLYGANLVIPCINIQEYIGSNLWSIIDVLISLFMIYNLSQLFITAFDGITSLNDDFQVLYGARHVASPQTRVERNSDLY